MRGEHDRSCSSSSLAACPSGEDSFVFVLDPHCTYISPGSVRDLSKKSGREAPKEEEKKGRSCSPPRTACRRQSHLSGGVKRRACLTPPDKCDRAAPRPYGEENTKRPVCASVRGWWVRVAGGPGGWWTWVAGGPGWLVDLGSWRVRVSVPEWRHLGGGAHGPGVACLGQRAAARTGPRRGAARVRPLVLGPRPPSTGTASPRRGAGELFTRMGGSRAGGREGLAPSADVRASARRRSPPAAPPTAGPAIHRPGPRTRRPGRSIAAVSWNKARDPDHSGRRI